MEAEFEIVELEAQPAIAISKEVDPRDREEVGRALWQAGGIFEWQGGASYRSAIFTLPLVR